MSRTLSWIDVLNEESTWTQRSQVADWLAALLDSSGFSDSDLSTFERELTSMRAALGTLHFGGRPDLGWLDNRLTNIQLTICYEQFLPQSCISALPLLHARVEGNDPDALLKALTETMLLQFADFIARAVAEEKAPSIARCEGLFKENSNAKLSTVRSISDESERQWRKEIEVLCQNDLTDTPAIQRCADIFIAGPKAKFCSDACRFATFQLLKQLKDSRYHADKQKKYRTKLADKK